MSNDILKKQLELVRFEKTMDYVYQSSGGPKRLNSNELAHLNQMLRHKQDVPWRSTPVSIDIPSSGKTYDFGVISNSQMEASHIIAKAHDIAANGDIPEAATHLYSELMLKHLFNDANRRTAVAAMAWLMLEYDVSIPAMGLLELGVGDIRQPEQRQALKSIIENSIIMSGKKR